MWPARRLPAANEVGTPIKRPLSHMTEGSFYRSIKNLMLAPTYSSP